MTSFHAASGYCSTVVFGPVMPALQTSASMRFSAASRRRERRRDGVFARDVDRRHVASAQRLRGGFERRGVAVPQADARAGRDEPPRDRQSDTRRAAGDDGGAPLHVELIHALPLPAAGAPPHDYIASAGNWSDHLTAFR